MWPPHQTADEESDQLYPGETYVKLLRRFSNDRALTTHWWNGCCACGFRHLLVFKVFRKKNKSGEEFWLGISAYGDEESRPKKVVRVRAKGGKPAK